MEWQIIIAVIVAVPVILFPVALIWYLNLDGIMTGIKEFKSKKAFHEKESKIV